MTPEAMKEKAQQMFLKRFHCSQAVLAVGQERLGIGGEELIRAMGPFGGGLASGEVCGALSGALATIGLKLGRAREEEKESRLMWDCAREMMDRFREAAGGSIHCRNLVGVDWRDPEQARAFYRSDKVRTCLRVTGEAARILGEMLDRLDHKGQAEVQAG
jgi:C_GCAxxG_C_C family probable redox protein